MNTVLVGINMKPHCGRHWPHMGEGATEQPVFTHSSPEVNILVKDLHAVVSRAKKRRAGLKMLKCRSIVQTYPL